MARGRPRKIQEPEEAEEAEMKDEELEEKVSEKEKLLALRKQLADLRVNSISDLDGLISRAE